MSRDRFAIGLFLLVILAGVARARGDSPSPLAIDVDARDISRRLLHTTITIPCRPGKLHLWYPKWIPGTHGPYGPVQNIGGLRLETADGKAISWKRDDVDLYRVTCEVPAGCSAVRARLDYICNEAANHAMGHLSAGNRSLAVINWNTCVLYPEVAGSPELPVRLSLRLPEKWRHASALKTDEVKDGRIVFQVRSLYDVLDSPLIAGEHLHTFKLDTGRFPQAFLHLASESPSALKLPAKVVDHYSRVVREACTLFGTAHYAEYHFLVTCSDDLGYLGLEHHASCLNGVKERDLIDDARRKDWVANLLPHEYAHSWCGKFRRPAGMCTPDFHTPQKMRLLWVYEGLTMYLGDVLMVRSGLIDAGEYRDMLAWTIGNLKLREGRRWRSLEDTAVASYLLRAPSANWEDLRRGQDYYQEGLLIWLEVDAILRDLSKGKHSLDDFCKRFMGRLPAQKLGAPANRSAPVVPYELPEILKILHELADHDWEAFFQRRVSAPQETLPLDVVGRLGYRLHFTDKPSQYLKYLEKRDKTPTVSARDSLGLLFNGDGKILHVYPGTVAAKAGLVSGAQVQGVNGKKFSAQSLQAALEDSPTLGKIDLLVLERDRFRTITLAYADGPRYLELVRAPARPDHLAAILKPRVGHVSKVPRGASDLDRKILAAAENGSEIMANLSYLCDMIGPRLTGSAALKKGNEWTAGKMKAYGLTNVHLEPWPLPEGWRRGHARGRVIEPDNGRALSLASFGWAPGTGGTVQGDVVILKAKKPADLAAYKGKLKGAIVLAGPPGKLRPLAEIERPDDGIPSHATVPPKKPISTEERLAFLRALRDFMSREQPAALLMDANKHLGLLTTTGAWGTWLGDPDDVRPSALNRFPWLFVAHEHYAMLYRLAGRPAPARTRVELDVANTFVPGPVAVYNTVGEIRGSEKPGEFVIIAAHLDSWDLAQGALDNGAGSVVVLEAARILARSGAKPKRTIRFILFTGEEQGLHGSQAYVKAHKAELPYTSVCLVHDNGTGKVDGLRWMGRPYLRPILEKELGFLKELGVQQFHARGGIGSDHASFDKAGVPGGQCKQEIAGYRFAHHSQADTIELAQEPDLIQGAEVLALAALRFANMDGLLPREEKKSSGR
jgi:predicted metalloprotease with PDZ domain